MLCSACEHTQEILSLLSLRFLSLRTVPECCPLQQTLLSFTVGLLCLLNQASPLEPAQLLALGHVRSGGGGGLLSKPVLMGGQPWRWGHVSGRWAEPQSPECWALESWTGMSIDDTEGFSRHGYLQGGSQAGWVSTLTSEQMLFRLSWGWGACV